MPLGVATVMSATPAPWAGEMAVTEVAEPTEYEVAGTEPKLTALAPKRSVPVMVTDVAPVVGPATGLMALTAGASS